MPDPKDPAPENRTEADWVRILSEEYESAWEPEGSARMAELVRRAPSAFAVSVARALVAIDRQRRHAAGLTRFAHATYLTMFPMFAADPAWLGANEDAIAESAAARPEPPPVQWIGRYQVIRSLGRGAEAEVFLCTHPNWNQHVVVKWMHEHVRDLSDWRERFARQGEVLNGLEHPGIVKVYDQGEHDRRPFLVTEFIQGVTLDQYYRDNNLTPVEKAALIAGVAAALNFAHGKGAVHQDIKPQNILVDQEKRAKVIDFGFAWFRPAWSGGEDQHGVVGGTLCYMSPEQVNGKDVTALTDVFALGGLLYFLITGRPPYSDSSREAVRTKVADCDWDRDTLTHAEAPERLKAVCRRALAKYPRDRYASAAAMAAATKAAVRIPRLLIIAVVLLASLVPGAVIGYPYLNRWLNSPMLTVKVLRPGFESFPLAEVVPLRDKDSLHVSFRVPRGVHASLVSIDGDGNLVVLQSYPLADAAREVVWPDSGKARELSPPAGTEFLFVCGRSDRPVDVQELQAAWNVGGNWPALKPETEVLRVRWHEIATESVKQRGFGKVVNFPEGDTVKGRLERFRERLRKTLPGYTVFEGVAFRHD